MKRLVFLPDRNGRDDLGDTLGFVRMGAQAGELQQLAERLAAPAEQAEAAADETAWRSAVTLALLTDVWADCGSALSVMTVDGSTSPFASWVLAARPETERDKPVQLILLEREGVRRLLGVADAKAGLKLPAAPSDLRDVLPEQAKWMDRANGEISDPIPFLNEYDRDLLVGRMEALGLHTPMALAYMEALRTADTAETEAVRMQDGAALERLAIRMEAVCGLTDFVEFTSVSQVYAAGGNVLMRCLIQQDGGGEANVNRSQTYLWRGIPFASTSRVLGLTGANHPEAVTVLDVIQEELTMMSGSSVKWNAATGERMQRWLDAAEANALLLPQARERIEASCALMQENGRQLQGTVALTWPWDASSGAVRAILVETLGEAWLEAAANPFSDRLTKLTGRLMGDTALQNCCACADGVLLPPVSQAMAACASRAGRSGSFVMDATRFQPREDGGITASFLLRGEGEVCMIRAYEAEEICVLEEEEAPTVAVWPCLPMESWRAYYVFAKGGVELAACCDGAWKSLLPEAALDEAVWRCMHVTEYPGCLTLMREGLCLGALPNMLPAFRPEEKGDVVVGLDLGSSRTATAFAWDGVPTLIEGRDLTRVLVMPQEMPDDGFLGSLTPSSVAPTAAALTGDGDDLFIDGYAYRPESLSDLAAFDAKKLRARLKWRADADSVRARRLLMHQVMLGAALNAAAEGARSISWRLTIADEMGDEGREAMVWAATELAILVAAETGLPLTDAARPVEWAEESAALCACLRAEGTGRGSCISADFGSGSTRLHLWMANQSKPALGSVVFEGVQDVLLRFYRQQPMRLLEDFADCGDEALIKDVLAIVDQMNPDLMNARQLDKLYLMLDMLLDTRRTAIGQHLHARAGANRPTFLQSILLETEAATLFTAGLMLAQAGENSAISHLLPEDVTVCLTGRGAWLLETLTPLARNALQHLTHAPMRLGHPVRFITIRPAASPAQSVAMGMAVVRDTGRIADAPLIRTRESFSGLMQRMMQQLCASFPVHMWLLHEGLFDWQSGSITAAGADSIRRAAAQCYGDGEDVAASARDFVRMLREAPIVPDASVDPNN